jgi:aerobic-type carbon monoxide dehydrogenase small subunit (CoxS/CutS family)
MSAPMSFPEPVRRGDTSHCGACTVVPDGASVKSWTLLAAQAVRRGDIRLRYGHAG